MSLLGDAVQTLNEDIEIAAFLPGANFVFILIASGNGSDQLFAFALASAIVGTALFNHLHSRTSDDPNSNGEPEEVSESQESRGQAFSGEETDSTTSGWISQQTASAVLILPWAALLFISMYFLLERFPKNWILPEVLFFISVGFISLYLTHYILDRIVIKYGE